MMMVAAAGLQAADDPVSVTVDATYETKYLFRGVQLADDSFHPSVEVSSGDFYAGVWGNIAFGSYSKFPDNREWDIYFGKNIALSDIATLDVGLTYYWYPEVPASSTGSTTEVYVGMNWDVQGFSPGLYAYYDFTLKAWTLQTSIGTSIPLERLGASLDLSAGLGHVDGDGFNYTYWSLGASVPVKLSEKSTITIGGTFASHDISGLDDNNLTGSLSYTFAF